MKYMVIIYGNKDLRQSFPPDVAARNIAEVDAFNARYMESGELLGAYGLGDELTAKTVRVREGVPAVTDGPYLEAKEFVSSFFLIDCEGEKRPDETELTTRLLAVMHVLYLIFNEGYTSSSGDVVTRFELTGEAVRLARGLHTSLPDDPEVTGLLALMLLTDARRSARTTAEGDLIDLADQDRGLWDQAQIEEGVALITDALGQGPIGSYQLQAAIAAVHDEARSSASTDWPQILALYDLLDRIAPNPMASLNRAVALAMVQGPVAGLSLLSSLDEDKRVAQHHRLHAVRGHLLEMAGDRVAARESFQVAFRRTTSSREKRYLQRRIDSLKS